MGNIDFKVENTEAIVAELAGIGALARTATEKKLEESRGEASESIGNLEDSVVKINTEISMISVNTGLLLNCLASTWEEFEANIRAQWQ